RAGHADGGLRPAGGGDGVRGVAPPGRCGERHPVLGDGARRSAASGVMSAPASNAAWFERARRVLPGGVSSPVRAFGSVGGVPPFVVSARGPYVTDAEGTERVDLVGSWGPAILGHAHPAVVEAVQEAAARGLSFGAPTAGEVELAEAVRSRLERAAASAPPSSSPRVPCPVELVRFVSTGTEATTTALGL